MQGLSSIYNGLLYYGCGKTVLGPLDSGCFRKVEDDLPVPVLTLFRDRMLVTSPVLCIASPLT